jgi:hypothetical protein
MFARDRRDIIERAVKLLEERKEEFKEAYQHDTYASDLIVNADFTRQSYLGGVLRKRKEGWTGRADPINSTASSEATRQTKEAASL